MITARRAIKAAGKHVSRGMLAVKTSLGAAALRHCPACGCDVVGFFRYGRVADWGCPLCHASPRERLVCHLIDTGALVLPKAGGILHMAPNEAGLVTRFHAATSDYVPADAHPGRFLLNGVRVLDLMELGEQNRYDLFYASHVMEHVPDDMQVLRNIYSALKPGGEAWLIVPLWSRPTEDGGANMTARQRESRFGQWDHLRQYGPDFADRIRQAGFVVDELRAIDCNAADVASMGLDDVVFRARKPEAAGGESGA